MEEYIAKQKIYNVIEKTSRLEMENLQKDASLIKENIDQNQMVIDEKKQKINSILETMQVNSKEQSIDVGMFEQRYQYLNVLQDELLHNELISKSLKKRHDKQMDKVKSQYQQTKLYEKMTDKNNQKIRSYLLKEEEKVTEELANNYRVEEYSYE